MELIVDLLKNATKRVTLVALAPLTNIALAIHANAALCKERIERIIWMGMIFKASSSFFWFCCLAVSARLSVVLVSGGTRFAGGNYSAWGEANAVSTLIHTNERHI